MPRKLSVDSISAQSSSLWNRGIFTTGRRIAMIKGFGGASIWSQDLNNLLPFYRDTLGLTPTMESERFVVFGDINGPTLGLGSHSEVKGKNSDPARHMVGLTT